MTTLGQAIIGTLICAGVLSALIALFAVMSNAHCRRE